MSKEPWLKGEGARASVRMKSQLSLPRLVCAVVVLGYILGWPHLVHLSVGGGCLPTCRWSSALVLLLLSHPSPCTTLLSPLSPVAAVCAMMMMMGPAHLNRHPVLYPLCAGVCPQPCLLPPHSRASMYSVPPPPPRLDVVVAVDSLAVARGLPACCLPPSSLGADAPHTHTATPSSCCCCRCWPWS